MKNLWKTLTYCTLIVLCVACDKKEEAAKAQADMAIEAAADMARADQGTSPASEPEEKVALDPARIESFPSRSMAASCQWRARCKNEELVRYIQFNEALLIALSGLSRQDLESELDEASAIFEKLDQEKRLRLSPQECETVMSATTAIARIDPASLQASEQAGRVVYNAARAKTCLDDLAKLDPLCEQEITFDMTQKVDVKALGEKYKQHVESLDMVCDGVLVGQLDSGEECIAAYECKAKMNCEKPKAGALVVGDVASNKQVCTPAKDGEASGAD